MIVKPYTCEMCGHVVEGEDMDAFVAALTTHVREVHEWPYPDVAISNFAAATQRVDGPTERLETIGSVEIHHVDASRLADWQQFFDREAFAGNFAWASCYCAEPHCLDPKRREETETDGRTWEHNRSTMEGLITSGTSFGYLAYVDGHAAGWVNASLRSDYALYRLGDGAEPADDDVIGVACFVIAPPYRGHGLAPKLLDRVLADAPGRGARWIEAYPFNEATKAEALANFRGDRRMFDERGFEPVEERERDVVVRRRV